MANDEKNKTKTLYSESGAGEGTSQDEEKEGQESPDSEGSSGGHDLPDGEESLIIFTDAAREAFIKTTIQEGVPEDTVLRLGVVGGGCSGFNYDMFFNEKTTARDRIIVSNGVNLVVDEMSLMYLAGTIVDFASSLKGSGFTFNNPNAKSTCGCAMSFTV